MAFCADGRVPIVMRPTPTTANSNENAARLFRIWQIPLMSVRTPVSNTSGREPARRFYPTAGNALKGVFYYSFRDVDVPWSGRRRRVPAPGLGTRRSSACPELLRTDRADPADALRLLSSAGRRRTVQPDVVCG